MEFFAIADNADNHGVGKGRFGRRLIFFLLLAFLLPALPTRGASPTPADILLVCNNSMKGSCEVARHYARKRGVPVQNLVRLELPLSERVDRRVYETELATPLRQKVVIFKKKKKHSPVLLLVYGIPLKIAADPTGRGQQLSPDLAQSRVAALTSQIGGSGPAGRLDRTKTLARPSTGDRCSENPAPKSCGSDPTEQRFF
jgi:hypothetical protein